MEYDFIKRRTDTQYTDIEKFKKYEFTECISFELAVRAAKDTLIELIGLKTQKGNHLERRNRIRELEKKLKEEYWLKPMYFYNPDNTLNIPTSDSLKKSVRKRKGYHTHTRSLLYAYYYHFLKEVMPEEYRLALNIKGDENSLPSLIGVGGSNEEGTADYVLNSYTDTIEKSDRTLTKKKSRPSLLIPKEHSNELLVKINPNLPPEENKAFLEDALKDIYARKSSLSMNELIKSMPENDEDKSIEIINHDKNEYKNKKMANMFYTYDYVTLIKDEVKAHNKIIEDKLLDSNIDRYDRETLREDLSKYTEAKTIIDSEEHGDFLSSQLNNLKKSTIGDYYNIIHSLIKENQYKQLI